MWDFTDVSNEQLHNNHVWLRKMKYEIEKLRRINVAGSLVCAQHTHGSVLYFLHIRPGFHGDKYESLHWVIMNLSHVLSSVSSYTMKKLAQYFKGLSQLLAVFYISMALDIFWKNLVGPIIIEKKKIVAKWSLWVCPGAVAGCESFCLSALRGWLLRQSQVEKREKDQPEGCRM